MHRRFSLALFLLLLIITPISLQAQPSELTREVWVFYLSFWAGENTWQWNENVLIDRPLLGYYNSKMPDVADVQIQQAITTGIDAFIVNWWGIDESVTTTPALVNLLDRANYNRFEIGVAVDLYPQDFFQNRDQLERSLTWLYENALTHPAYLHYNGKPIVLFAFQDRFDWRTWRDLRENIDPDHNAIWIAEGLGACCLYNGVMEGMYAFNMAWANGNPDYYIAERNLIFERGGELYIPTISPGWDEDIIAQLTNRPNPTSPRDRADGQFLTSSWNGVLEVESDVILVVSWNEFIENSHIEPSERFGTQSLDVLRPLITDWRGEEPQRASPLPASYVITTRENIEDAVNVYAEPNRNSAIIGQLQVESIYPIVDEDNGLYGIAFDDATGYVAWEAISIMSIE